jgi:hypothetical protein
MVEFKEKMIFSPEILVSAINDKILEGLNNVLSREVD